MNLLRLHLLRHLSEKEKPVSIYELTDILSDDPEEAFPSVLDNVYSLAGQGLVEISSLDTEDGSETAVTVSSLGRSYLQSEDIKSGVYLRK